MAENKQLTEAVNSLTLKRYRVSVVTMGLHSFTVTATSEEEASSKVMQGEGGRDAGREGPVPFAVRVHDMTQLEVKPITLQNVINEMMASLREQPQQQRPAVDPNPGGLIQVIKE